MKRPFLDHVEALSAIAAALDAALYIATDPTAADLVTELIAWSQETAQLATLLEQTDLCPVERAQFAALLAALRIEAGIRREALQ